MSFISFFVALGLFVATQIGALTYDRFVTVEKPPIGRINWIDALFILAVLNITPFLFLVFPSFLVLALFSISFTAGLYYALKPFVRIRPLVILVALLIIAFQIWNPTMYLNDIIVMSTVIGIAALYTQSGLKPIELVLLGVGYSVYDFTLGRYTPLIIQLTLKLGSIQIAPILIVSNFVIGAADVMLASLYVVALRRKFGIRLSAVCVLLSTFIVALIGLQLVQGEFFLPIGSSKGFPLAPWITIPFLALWGFQSSVSKKFRPHQSVGLEPVWVQGSADSHLNRFKFCPGSVKGTLKREHRSSKLFDVTPNVLHERLFTSKHVPIFHHALKIASNQALLTKISQK
jgi:hypothetical protein